MTGPLLDRAIAAQPEGDSVTGVLLEARLGAELYFSDEPGRARDLVESAVDRARRLDDCSALGAATAVTHDAFVVGQRDLADQLLESDQLLDWARATGSAAALLTAHRARVFDLLAAGDVAGMDAEILAFRRLAEPLAGARLPVVAGTLGRRCARCSTAVTTTPRTGRWRPTRSARRRSRRSPSATCRSCCSSCAASRAVSLRWSRPPGTTSATHADIPALRVSLLFLLAEIGRVDEARGMLATIDDGALDRLHDRNWPASWFQLARAAAVVGDCDLAARLLEDRRQPSERCVMVSLATVCLGATDLATAWLLHTLGDLDAADERYRSAAAVNARIGARGWLAQARADHARLLLDRDGAGDRDAARRLIELAVDAADDIGLASIAPALDDLRRRLDQPAPVATTAGGKPERGVVPPSRIGVGARLRRPDGAASHTRGSARPRVPAGQARPGACRCWSSPTRRGRHGGRPRAPRRSTSAPVARSVTVSTSSTQRRPTPRQTVRASEPPWRASSASHWPRRSHATSGSVADHGGSAIRSSVPARPCRPASGEPSRTVGRAHPELGRHLERSIDTGAWCAYRPAEPVTWIT